MADGDFVKVAELSEVGPGDMKMVEVGGEQILGNRNVAVPDYLRGHLQSQCLSTEVQPLFGGGRGD